MGTYTVQNIVLYTYICYYMFSFLLLEPSYGLLHKKVRNKSTSKSTYIQLLLTYLLFWLVFGQSIASVCSAPFYLCFFLFLPMLSGVSSWWCCDVFVEPIVVGMTVILGESSVFEIMLVSPKLHVILFDQAVHTLVVIICVVPLFDPPWFDHCSDHVCWFTYPCCWDCDLAQLW